MQYHGLFISDGIINIIILKLDLPDDFNTDKKLADALRKKQLLVSMLYKEGNRHIREYAANMHINDYNGDLMDRPCLKTFILSYIN